MIFIPSNNNIVINKRTARHRQSAIIKGLIVLFYNSSGLSALHSSTTRLTNGTRLEVKVLRLVGSENDDELPVADSPLLIHFNHSKHYVAPSFSRSPYRGGWEKTEGLYESTAIIENTCSTRTYPRIWFSFSIPVLEHWVNNASPNGMKPLLLLLDLMEVKDVSCTVHIIRITIT